MRCSVLSVNSSWFGVGAFVTSASRGPTLNLRWNTAWLKPMPFLILPIDPYTPSYPVKIEVGVVPNGCIVASPLPFE